MGYIIVLFLGVLLVGFLIAAFGRSRPVGQVSPRGRDATFKQPLSAEPTPPRSDTAREDQVERASRHTPPA